MWRRKEKERKEERNEVSDKGEREYVMGIKIECLNPWLSQVT